MALIFKNSLFENSNRIPAREVSSLLRRVIRATGAPERVIAQGVDMAESQLNRLISLKQGNVKAQTVRSLNRLAILLDETEKTLSSKGVGKWLITPNTGLDDVPPILCLRTDKELKRVLSLLASIRFGFPA